MAPIPGFQVVAYAYGAGWVGDALTQAVAIAKAETNWDPAYLFKGPETEQRGLWGINWIDHTNFDRLQLMDPGYNAASAWILWAQNGNQWVDWQSYLDGSYRAHMGEASNAVAQWESLGGTPGSNPNPNPGNGAPPPGSGSFPIPGNWDPAPALRALGDYLYWMAGNLDNASNAIENIQ